MRQRATWLVVLAVSALGIAAGVDALSGGGESKREPAPAPTTLASSPEGTGSAEETTVVGGFSGVLYYTDDDCRLRAVRLPGLTGAPAPPWHACRFSLSPDGSRVAPAGARWGTNGELFPAAPGRAAASVTPDGRLTVVRGDDLVDARSGAVLVSEALLSRAVMTAPSVPEDARLVRFRVDQTAWLSETRVAALLSADVRYGPQGEEMLAIFDGRRLVDVEWGLGHLSDLRTSPEGGFLAVRTTSRAGYLLVDRDGDPVPAPPVTGYRTIAWAPDESWAAVATVASVYVFRAGESELRLRRLAFAAHDLAWRGETGPSLPATTALVSWLERAGVSGDLYVSDAGCRIRSLRMPAVIWRSPAGSPGPCRFSVAPSGRITDRFVVWQQRGNLGATCNGDTVDVFAADGSSRFIIDLACQPAWKPDGTLTVIREGSLLELPRLRRERVALSAERLQQALGPDARLEEAAWIDDDEFAAAIRRGTKAYLAVFHHDRLVARPVFRSPRIEGIEPNGRGLIAAQTGFGADRITFFALDGRPLFSVPGGRVIAWSPGGGIAAVAVGHSVLFVDPLARATRRLPLFASDLQWR